MSPERRLAVLLGGVTSDRSFSMSRHARELSRALAVICQKSWQFELVQPEQRRWLSMVWDRPQTTRLDSALMRYLAYPARVRRRSADLFHILDHGYAHLLRALDPERTIVTCHDVIPLLGAEGRIRMHVPATVTRTFVFRLESMARASWILVPSDTTRNELLRYSDIPASRITVIPWAASAAFRAGDPERRRDVRQRLDLPVDAAVVLQVASAGRYKNTPVLIRAFARLRERLGAHVILARIGGDLYEDERALADRLGVTAAMRLIGRVPDDEVLARWYQAADVLAFPSLWEGFGWPPLEAMACGTPVVASDIPAVREVVQDAAVLVHPESDEHLTDAIEGVLSDAAHSRSLRIAGLQRAGQFSWEETARRTLSIYEAVEGAGHRVSGQVVMKGANA
jgi:glycosyltransferase involved in cell wall biosynthesis